MIIHCASVLKREEDMMIRQQEQGDEINSGNNYIRLISEVMLAKLLFLLQLLLLRMI
jgi:hypothetical protein